MMEVYCGKCKIRTPTINIVDRTFIWIKNIVETVAYVELRDLYI